MAFAGPPPRSGAPELGSAAAASALVLDPRRRASPTFDPLASTAVAPVLNIDSPIPANSDAFPGLPLMGTDHFAPPTDSPCSRPSSPPRRAAWPPRRRVAPPVSTSPDSSLPSPASAARVGARRLPRAVGHGCGLELLPPLPCRAPTAMDQLREEEHATAAAHECGRELLPPLNCSRTCHAPLPWA